jgi:hypothetical protein
MKMKIKKIENTLVIFNSSYFVFKKNILLNSFLLNKLNKVNNIVIKIKVSAKNLEKIIVVGINK